MAEAEGRAERLNMACYELAQELGELDCSVPQAVPLARSLLRVVGRVVIDTGVEGADPATWEGTESMVLQWLDEAVRPLGYELRPAAGGGRPELASPAPDLSGPGPRRSRRG